MSDQPTALTTKLTPAERSDLERCEQVIKRGRKVFLQVGAALEEIRDKQLYRETYSTFEKYCRKRWDFGARRGQQLLAASEVINNLRPMGRIPENERQARPLVSLPPETQRQVWQEAVETAPDGKITVAHIQAVVDQHQHPDEGAPADDVSAPLMRTMVRISESEMPPAAVDWVAVLQPQSFYLTDPRERIVYTTPYFSHWEVERIKEKGMVPQRGAYIINKEAFKDYRFEKLVRPNDSTPDVQALHAAGIDDSTSPDEPTTPRHDPRQVSNAGEWTPGETAYIHRAQSAVNNAHPGKMPYVGKPAAVDELERLHARVLELESENARLVAENMRLRAEVVNLRSLAKLPDVKQPSPERML